jgi:hypothetical protein
MTSNRIDAAFTAEQREKAKAAIATLAETLPFLIDLSAEDRASLPKFGEKNCLWSSRRCPLPKDTPKSSRPALALRISHR